ncbi:MAG: hypothetical protein JO327_10505 [Nitrososphaeraceae archaeon]|nr:hypothetical protein [Nitrososphaeraceae archaeon]
MEVNLKTLVHPATHKLRSASKGIALGLGIELVSRGGVLYMISKRLEEMAYFYIDLI